MDAAYQGVRTTRNQVYVLTFDMHAKDASLRDSDKETMLVKWNGEVLGRFQATEPDSWTRYHLIVTGTGGRDKLSFHKMVAGGDGPGGRAIKSGSRALEAPTSFPLKK